MTRRSPRRPMLVRWELGPDGASRVVTQPLLRDVATICLAVLRMPPGADNLVCELDAGHLDQGQKHKSGCTRWGRPAEKPEVTDADS